MLNVQIKDKQVRNIIKRITKDHSIKKEFLNNIGTKGQQIVKQQAKEISATGKLVNSIYFSVQGDRAVVVDSRANYALIAMETGRGPGKQPRTEDLRRWAGLKLGNPKLAYVVARKIAKFGTRKYKGYGKKLRTESIKELTKSLPQFIKKIEKYYLNG